MTPWQWFWLPADGDEYGGWDGEHGSKEQAILRAQRELRSGDVFFVIEARSSTAMEHEGAECVPFLRTRNKERLIVGPTLNQGPSHD